jgi:hypothetical protein
MHLQPGAETNVYVRSYGSGRGVHSLLRVSPHKASNVRDIARSSPHMWPCAERRPNLG